MKKRLALALISGGLDSSLAAYIIAQNHNVDVIGYFFSHPFTPGIGDDYLLPAEKAARQIGIPLIIDSDSMAFIDMVKSPFYGTGKGVNPCRDCRIFILQRAKRVLEKMGGDFLVTGEVVGQRPMSQLKNSINLIAKRSGAKEIIVRPLSAKLLKPSLPEEKGWINREDLYGLASRNRTPQIAMAKEFGIDNYPAPAGGCPLTEPSYGVKFADLVEHKSNLDYIDVEALSIGRHFRLQDGSKLIVARNERESDWIFDRLMGKYTVLFSQKILGPVGALQDYHDKSSIRTAAGLTLGYGKTREYPEIVIRVFHPDGSTENMAVKPLNKDAFRKYLLI